MGLTASRRAQRLEDDPRCQPGAYLTLEGHFYEVANTRRAQQYTNVGPHSVLSVQVIDCMSPMDEPVTRWLNEQQIKASVLRRAAPVVSDTLPAA